ncbi:hypothetical protein V8F20_005547 [Naviculisporaceae sp. PSN 640]
MTRRVICLVEREFYFSKSPNTFANISLHQARSLPFDLGETSLVEKSICINLRITTQDFLIPTPAHLPFSSAEEIFWHQDFSESIGVVTNPRSHIQEKAILVSTPASNLRRLAMQDETNNRQVDGTANTSPRAIIKSYADLREHEKTQCFKIIEEILTLKYTDVSEFFAKVFADSWTTDHLPLAPRMKKPKFRNTAVYVGKWKRDLPLEEPSRRRTKEQSPFRLRGARAFVKVAINAPLMSIQYKVVDTQGIAANAEFVEWEEGEELSLAKAAEAVAKAECHEIRFVDAWNTDLAVYEVRTLLCNCVRPAPNVTEVSNGTATPEAHAATLKKAKATRVSSSSSGPLSAKRKREEAEQELAYLSYTDRSLPVLRQLANVYQRCVEEGLDTSFGELKISAL